MKIAKVFNGNIDQALEKWPKHLYVKNSCKDNMTLLVGVKDSSNTTVSIRFPKTWFPIDILNYVDAESARKSSQIRGMIRSGNLKILDADSAEEVLNMPDSRDEAKRLNLLDYNSSEAENEEEKVEVIPQKQQEEIEQDFYSIRKFAIEEAENDEEALIAASEVYSTYVADMDDAMIKDSKLTKKIESIKEAATNKGFKKSAEKMEELLKFIAENQ